jgi:hypothetical protein
VGQTAEKEAITREHQVAEIEGSQKDVDGKHNDATKQLLNVPNQQGDVVSQNLLNYKSTRTKTITGAVKFPHLSTYGTGGPRNHEGFQTNQPTSQDRT